jgi:hypothetical protein
VAACRPPTGAVLAALFLASAFCFALRCLAQATRLRLFIESNANRHLQTGSIREPAEPLAVGHALGELDGAFLSA